MKVKVEDSGPCRKTLSIEAPAAETAEDYKQALQAVARVAEIDGFRKGKAPVPMVERRFRKAVEDETRDNLVPRLYRDAIAKEDIKAVAIVQVRDVAYAPEKGVSFKVIVDVPPEFKLPKYGKIEIKRNAVAVTDEQVNGAIDRLLDSQSRFEDVEGRETKSGDLVLADYVGKCDGKPVTTMAADCAGLGEGKDAWILLEEREFIPGFTRGLTGAKAGSVVEIDVEFPPDYGTKAVAGKKASYSVTVKRIRQRVRPTMDEAFFKQFQASDLEGLKSRARTELQSEGDRREDERVKELLARELLGKTPFDLPQSVVEEEVRLTVKELVRRNMMRGLTEQQLEEQKNDILQTATRTSEERVRLSYILARIADEEKIAVSEEELKSRMDEMAGRYRMEPAAFRDEIEKRNGVESIRSDLRAEKTLDFLAKKVSKN